MARREYKGGAAPLKLDVAVSAGALTVVTTGDVTGWPTGSSNPFYVEIDREVAGKAEKLLVTSRTGNTLTVTTRGVDGTTGVSHDAGAAVEHVLDSLTIDEVNAHVNDTSRDDHTQYLTTGRHDVTARHLVGTSIAKGTPGTSAPGDTASAGVATSAAASDHRHGRESFGLVGNVSSSAPGDTALAGTSGKPADANHRHAREAWGVVGDLSSSAPGATALAGTSGHVADANHRHAREDVYGLTQDEDKNDGDTSAIAGGTSLVVATKAITTTATRIIDIHCSVTLRASTNDAHAGNVYIYQNGAPLFGAIRRFNTHLATGTAASIPLNVSFSTRTRQAAGTWTYTIVVINDVGAINIIASNRCLNVFSEGG